MHMQNSLPDHEIDEAVRTAAYRRLDLLTKPQGSLGRLEHLAAQMCALQGTLQIRVSDPVGIVFAADHGIANRGVSAYPREVTVQMVANYLRGGAAISVLARLHGLDLWIVDAGVDGDCGTHPRLINAKVRNGTRDFVEGAAMTAAECADALDRGRDIVARKVGPLTNVLILGEMGIGNTSSSALLMHGLTGLPLIECVGRGTGLDDAGLDRKHAILAQALQRRVPPTDALQLLAEYGGFEIAMLTGALLAAAARGLLVLIDGFTVSVAAALASRVNSGVLGHCVFAHRSAEHAHHALLQHLRVEPLLQLDLRLGEGSGAALALPLLRAAAALFREMATFETAGVSDRDG
jgi:nicotinate-nucleotide--dimethylbenzimidazole phosphoribosyltransferase